jgi:hypothetical protein
MTMNTGLYRTELTRFTGLGGRSRTENPAAGYFRWGFVWLPATLVAGLGAWMLMSGYVSQRAESEPVRLATAAAPEPAVDPAPAMSLNPPATAGEVFTPLETAPVEGLRISSQSWRRGGLGSNALVTFTVRNGNNYAVKDIAIACAFARRDGSHLTDRTRVIHDTVNMKSRRTFARMHVGFVNINADRAKCSLVAASHI